MKLKLLATLIGALAIAHVHADEEAQLRAQCFDAVKGADNEAIIEQCELPADLGDAEAATSLALAILNSKTRFFDTTLTKEELAMRTFKLPVEEKIHLWDAITYLESAVEQNHPDAQFYLALLIRDTIISNNVEGQTIYLTQRFDRSNQLLFRAASQGQLGAIKQLASEILVYDKDKNLVDIHEHYLPFLQQMAASQTPEFVTILTQYNAFLAQAKAIRQNPENFAADKIANEAIRLLRKPNAQALALQLLNIAADKGSSKANYQLALFNDKQAPKQAFSFYMKAAEGKHPKAALWAAEYFGCQKDATQAKSWAKLALEQGNRNAEETLDELNQYGDISDCTRFEAYL